MTIDTMMHGAASSGLSSQAAHGLAPTDGRDRSRRFSGPEEKDDPQIKSVWVAEIRRRDQQIRAGERVTRPAEEVLREAREQLRCMR